MAQPKILMIEDEHKLAEALIAFLEASDFKVLWTDTISKAESLMSEGMPDLILLDWMLPDRSGMDFLKDLRKHSQVPVIMMTARAEEVDVLHGFEGGADDYVSKPFSMKQVLMRIKAVLRRSGVDLEALTCWQGYLKLSLAHRTLMAGETEVMLTPTEFAILNCLMKHPQKVFTREELIFSALGEDYEGTDRAVDSYIKNIRQKINVLREGSQVIETVHGVGYKLGVGI